MLDEAKNIVNNIKGTQEANEDTGGSRKGSSMLRNMQRRSAVTPTPLEIIGATSG